MPKDDLPESNPLLSLREICRLLGVSLRTVYRWIKSGQLPAMKVGGRWKCFRQDLAEYLSKQKFRYWRGGISHMFFRPEVLDKYKNSSDKYYVVDQAYDGWVGSHQDAYDVKVLQSAKKPLPKNYRPFVEVHYRKVPLKSGLVAIILTPEKYQSLPSVEYTHWASFIITTPENNIGLE